MEEPKSDEHGTESGPQLTSDSDFQIALANGVLRLYDRHRVIRKFTTPVPFTAYFGQICISQWLQMIHRIFSHIVTCICILRMRGAKLVCLLFK